MASVAFKREGMDLAGFLYENGKGRPISGIWKWKERKKRKI
jgi:hypothetical protein